MPPHTTSTTPCAPSAAETGHRGWIGELVRDLLSVGLPIHQGGDAAPAGGVAFVFEDEAGGIVLAWRLHLALAHRASAWQADVVQLLNYALAEVLCALGWRTRPFGADAACLVSGWLVDEEGA